ncbi:hypothetical protein [Pseudomonas eucalypticola]|uniref:HNH endonuclease n=1 Tax=Pseudomonas eucalypticola TaxID=2599595 RepID=A0A7D5H1U1_9PSED|nr:hypothetical protein [Pseudomonas eucalypticola]QKZ03382.1 hypothetical protein HWQ56_06100 [Pseudomonas eucalypticola]
MIKLELGDEPHELVAARQENWPAAVLLFNQHGVDHKEFRELLETGYQVAKPVLFQRQYEKCAFCERSEDAEFRPVEHFRPKKGAQDKVDARWVTTSGHYWWLAWTWSNLYFSCQSCNMAGKKGNKFPIEPGTARAQTPTRPIVGPVTPEFFDCSMERRLLLDPRLDDPLDHLQWIPVDRQLPKAKWRWTLEGLDSLGDMTIEVLDLDRRVDFVNRRLKGLQNLWEEVDLFIADDQLVNARRCWDKLLAQYIDDPYQEFRNAGWWAVDTLCPKDMRDRYGLRHPQIPVVTLPKAT